MNIIFRLIITLVRCLFANNIALLDKSQLHFRCLPTDCDLNMHMTNSRYLSFMDLGRLYFARQTGVMRLFFKKNWGGVISGLELTFIRPINPMQKFILITRILAWDEKYFYFEQKFISKNTLCATALVRGVFLHYGNKVPVGKIQEIIGDNSPTPEFPTMIKHWKELIELKKTHGDG